MDFGSRKPNLDTFDEFFISLLSCMYCKKYQKDKRLTAKSPRVQFDSLQSSRNIFS